ncbi:hypothetical protein SEA_RYADEL_98 [Mycobacterium phage Ryadel]|uniref:Uncharacterized protein n=1 Tax=Mycobacterium phage Ryadel TaxID=2283292 RepID=A0A345MF64_9CAUD|nr:hypothetical protein KNU03_gp098 [Mycobacterium phage Ryadel]ATW60578.1 hypothetical protein SEA_FAMILTON_96 [Mycobacterium phage Familton]AXH69195.1 hypothetical protein SEA_RYADEL_98 [Mycobacterium phage Ryadel]QGJ87416.1 hypothetical protein SEA_BLESSICA_96 [Mycobacterium phage Blessica]
MNEIRSLKPGILVSLKTHQSGNRAYQKREIERPHIAEGGVERSRWDTTKIVFDPEEAKEASQVANRARYLITRLCADTAHGPLCPMERREELHAAIAEARRMVEEFNAKAAFSRVEVNVICGEIVADDVNTARALFSETERFMAQMQDGLKELDVKKVRAACSKALDVGQMLSPNANADVKLAVNAAREACKKIVAAGEQVAVEIDRNAIEMIGLARSSFLDFEVDQDVEVEAFRDTGRAIDFEPTETEPEAVVRPSGYALDFEEVV